MGIAERSIRHKDALRHQILDAARVILTTEGFAKFSMRSIGKRIEYSPPTIYLYFKNQAELVLTLCEEVYGELADVLEAAAATPGSPLARLRAALRAYIDFGFADPTRYRLAFMTSLAPHVDASTPLEEGAQARRAAETLRQRVRAVLRAPTPQAEETTLQALWAVIHGVVAVVIEHPGFPFVPQERLIARTLALVLNGFGAPGRANGAASREAQPAGRAAGRQPRRTVSAC